MTTRPAAPPDIATQRIATPSIGIGTGCSPRLVDPGPARALAAAAQRLGYSSVWTFDAPAGLGSIVPIATRSMLDVLTTAAALAEGAPDVAVGIGLLRTRWPLRDGERERLALLTEANGRRIVVARPRSRGADDECDPTSASMLQLFRSEDELAAWAEGWMLERRSDDTARPPGRSGQTELVVRLPVDAAADSVLGQIDELSVAGASEIVLDVVADIGLDRALDLYSRIAEAVENRLGRTT